MRPYLGSVTHHRLDQFSSPGWEMQANILLCLLGLLIQHLSFFFRPLATAADYILDKGLKLAEMDEQSVEVIN